LGIGDVVLLNGAKDISFGDHGFLEHGLDAAHDGGVDE
jgi:hypothetical protein